MNNLTNDEIETVIGYVHLNTYKSLGYNKVPAGKLYIRVPSETCVKLIPIDLSTGNAVQKIHLDYDKGLFLEGVDGQKYYERINLIEAN